MITLVMHPLLLAAAARDAEVDCDIQSHADSVGR